MNTPYAVFHIEGGILQGWELHAQEASAIKTARKWAKSRGMTKQMSETWEPAEGSFHDEESDIFVQQPDKVQP